MTISTSLGERDVGPALEVLGYQGEVTWLHREAVRVATAQSGLTPAEQAQVAGSPAVREALEGWRSAVAEERSATANYAGWDPGAPDWEVAESEIGRAQDRTGWAERGLDQAVTEVTGREDAGENLRAMVDLAGPLLEQAGDPSLRGALHVEQALERGREQALERVTAPGQRPEELVAEGERHLAEARRVLASGPSAEQVLDTIQDLAAHPWSPEWSGSEEMDTPVITELGQAVADTGIHPDPGMLATTRMLVEQDPTYEGPRAGGGRRHTTLLPLDEDAPATTGAQPGPEWMQRVMDRLPAAAEPPEQVGLRGDTTMTWYPDVDRVAWSVEGWPGEHVGPAANFERRFATAWETHREAMEASTRLVGPQLEAARETLEEIRPRGVEMDSVLSWDPPTRSLEVSTGPEDSSERVYMVVDQDLDTRITDPDTGQAVEPAAARARLVEAAPPVEPDGPPVDPDGDWDPRFDLNVLLRGRAGSDLGEPHATEPSGTPQAGVPVVGQGRVPTSGHQPQVGQHTPPAVGGQEPGMRI